MIVDVTGFGWSGSGALHDLLREYDDVHFASFEDFEFTLLWEVDGIADLEYKLCDKHCRYGDSDKAIQRFLSKAKSLEDIKCFRYKELFHGDFFMLCKKYIDDLTQVEYNARNYDEIISNDFKEKRYMFLTKLWSRLLCNRIVWPIVWKLFHRNIVRDIVKPNNHTIRLAYNPEKFIERTHQLMNDLFAYLRPENRLIPIITDQFFPPDCPERFFKYIDEEAKCIVVKRDPRDLYLLSKFAYHSFIPIPTKTVEDFIIFYKKTIEETITPDTTRHITINFEDLVYDYDNTVKKIEDFVCVKAHTKKYAYFDPNKSIQNTQLYNYYKDCENDIRKIEAAVPASLFPFEFYSHSDVIRNKVY